LENFFISRGNVKADITPELLNLSEMEIENANEKIEPLNNTFSPISGKNGKNKNIN
jgi:hypothetical protein